MPTLIIAGTRHSVIGNIQTLGASHIRGVISNTTKMLFSSFKGRAESDYGFAVGICEDDVVRHLSSVLSSVMRELSSSRQAVWLSRIPLMVMGFTRPTIKLCVSFGRAIFSTSKLDDKADALSIMYEMVSSNFVV